MMTTGTTIAIAICSVFMLTAVRFKVYDDADAISVIDNIIACLISLVLFLSGIMLIDIHYDKSLMKILRRHPQYDVLAAARPPTMPLTTFNRALAIAFISGGGGGGRGRGGALEVTTSGSRMMATTAMVPRSHTLTHTLQVDFPSSSSGVKEPRVKVTTKLPHGEQITLMQRGSKPFTQTFRLEA